MLALVNAEAEDVNLKNCALGGSIILSTGGSTFVSAEGEDTEAEDSCGLGLSQNPLRHTVHHRSFTERGANHCLLWSTLED